MNIPVIHTERLLLRPFRASLERIDARKPEAKLELESLLAKMRTFKSAWIEFEKIRMAIAFESRYLDPIQAEQKRRGEKTRLSEGRESYYWFWEAYWKENGRDVSRRFSENAYGDAIAERKAREARLAALERLPNLRRRR